MAVRHFGVYHHRKRSGRRGERQTKNQTFTSRTNDKRTISARLNLHRHLTTHPSFFYFKFFF